MDASLLLRAGIIRILPPNCAGGCIPTLLVHILFIKVVWICTNCEYSSWGTYTALKRSSKSILCFN